MSEEHPRMQSDLVCLHVWEGEEWQERILRLAEAAGIVAPRLARAENGKPYIGGVHDFYFNISTTCGKTIAATARVPVGVDWEHTGREASYERIARRYFSIAEQQWMLAGRAPEEKRRRFFLLWTAKEAGVKLDGCGLYSGGLCNCIVQVPAEDERPCRGGLNGQNFCLRYVEFDGGLLAAVAAANDFRLALPQEFSKLE